MTCIPRELISKRVITVSLARKVISFKLFFRKVFNSSADDVTTSVDVFVEYDNSCKVASQK